MEISSTEKKGPEYIPFITDVQLVEGIVASTVFVFFMYIFKHKYKYSYVVFLSVPWFLTWLFRKLVPNVYLYVKKYYLGMEDVYTFYFTR